MIDGLIFKMKESFEVSEEKNICSPLRKSIFLLNKLLFGPEQETKKWSRKMEETIHTLKSPELSPFKWISKLEDPLQLRFAKRWN